eukprot:TRINITY_DN2098_c0_g1_i1.p1 TRINITY_DN2098_c0_g1~~TRINITY_DN2098_c0_g1_i1.p1  ORF type:complete len:124 (+),score=9.80 TRINITY_DN2098_c0_g1_i1:218-589(+)
MGILNPDQALGLPPRPKCPYPFVDAKSASPLDMACYWPCPDGFYSPSDWQTLVYLYLVSSIMSIVAVVSFSDIDCMANVTRTSSLIYGSLTCSMSSWCSHTCSPLTSGSSPRACWCMRSSVPA